MTPMKDPRPLLAVVCLLACACGDTGTPTNATDACATCADAATDGGSDGGLPLFAVCTRNEDCASMVCHYYPARNTSYCTKPCTTATDCPPPSPGCNMMGVCRIQ
jgi:hypothetical protein